MPRSGPLSTLPGELRGYLTVVPGTRWLKDPDHLSRCRNTTEHYAEHETDLRAVLAAAGASRPRRRRVRRRPPRRFPDIARPRPEG